MKKYFLLAAAVVSLAGCIDTNPELHEIHDYSNIANSKPYWGEWLRMDNADVWYIAGRYIKINNTFSSKTVALNKQSDRVIEVTDEGRKYYLLASRTANASFTGKIEGGIQDEYRSARAISGLGGIGAIISNLNDKANTTTVTTDSNGNFTANDIIPGDSYEITPKVEGGTPITVTPVADGDDVGVITVTGGLNFKTSIKPQSSSTDMSRLYADTNYAMTIEVENTGTVDCTAATYQLAFPADLVSDVPITGILRTIQPGIKKAIDITVRCQPILEEYEYKKIGVTVTDSINNRVWEDSVSLKFHKMPVSFNIRAESGRGVSGVIITPASRAYSFRNITSQSFSMPWSTKDYLVVFSGATADTEAVYSFGVNVTPDSNFDDFIALNNYEPNNTETAATTVAIGQKVMSYLHKNDIDYYKVNVGSTISGIPASDLSWTGSWTQTGSGKYTSNSIGNSAETWETLTINSASGGSLTVKLTASSEQGYDLGYASPLDGSPTKNSYQISVSGDESKSYTYIVPSGSHSIYFGYIKDGHTTGGNDNITVEIIN